MRVHFKVIEGNRQRIQVFEGIVHQAPGRRLPRDVHRPQAVVRRRRRAHVPAALAEDREARGGRRSATSAAQSSTTCAREWARRRASASSGRASDYPRPRGRSERPAAPRIRPPARRALRRRRRRGGARVARRAARRRRRAARLRVLRGHRVRPLALPERLEAGRAGGARGAASSAVLRLRRRGQRARHSAPARSTATGCIARTSRGLRAVLARPASAGRRVPRRRLPARPDRAAAQAPSSTATRRAPRSPRRRSSRRSSRDRVMRRLDALYPRYGFIVARRLHHAGAHARSSARSARPRSTAARSRPRCYEPRDPRADGVTAEERGERRALRQYRLRGYRMLGANVRSGRLRDRPGRAARAARRLLRGEGEGRRRLRRPARDGRGARRRRRVRAAADAWLAGPSGARRARGRASRWSAVPRSARRASRRSSDAGPATARERDAVAATQDALYRELDLELSWSEASSPSASARSTSTACIPTSGKFIPQLVEALLGRYVAPAGVCSTRSPARGRRSSRRSSPGYDATGVDIAAFNCLLMRVKTRRLQPVRAREASCATRSRDGALATQRRRDAAYVARVVRAAGGVRAAPLPRPRRRVRARRRAARRSSPGPRARRA